MPAFDPKARGPLRGTGLEPTHLLARRLVEAGVRLVTVDLPLVGHARDGLRFAACAFLPRFDRAYGLD